MKTTSMNRMKSGSQRKSRIAFYPFGELRTEGDSAEEAGAGSEGDHRLLRGYRDHRLLRGYRDHRLLRGYTACAALRRGQLNHPCRCSDTKASSVWLG